MISSRVEVPNLGNRYKGLILAAGEGKRISLDITLPKALLEINGETLLMHNLKKLLAANISEAVVAVGCKAAEVIRYSLEQDLSISLRFVHQTERLGTAHAVKAAKDILEDHPFILLYVDNFTDCGLESLLREHEERKNTATLALFRAEEPKKHGIAETQGRSVLKIVEKPEDPVTNLAFAGMAVFEKEIFPVLEEVKPSPKGEYYLTDAINILIRKGQKVGYTLLSGWRVNVNTLKEFKKAQRLAAFPFPPGKDSKMKNRLEAGKTRDVTSGFVNSR